MKIKRALISVSDKTGVVEFARSLAGLGVEIISTGGTAKALREAGVPVKPVSDVTGFPEILDGRVKTLHPAVHGGILAIRREDHLEQLKEHGITAIDLVAVNLYPFRETVAKPGVTFAEAIENIDIGGPTMVRSAAKNHADVVVVVNPEMYGEVADTLGAQGDIPKEMRLALALQAFRHTAEYDTAITAYLATTNVAGTGGVQAGAEVGSVGAAGAPDSPRAAQDTDFPELLTLSMKRDQILRYGENPHQMAAFYRDLDVSGPCVGNAEQLQGKGLSYNNILDLNAAFELVREFSEPAAVIIKHNNPCGVALAETVPEAYQKAFNADPVSAFGGIVAFNREVDDLTAAEMNKTFLEAVIAPGYTQAALAGFTQKPNLRVLKTGELDGQTSDRFEFRKVNGGMLLQEFDRQLLENSQMKIVSKAMPEDHDVAEMIFAMAIVKHVKSNAIVVTKGRQLLGIGAGQMNRVGSAKIALEQAGEQAKGAVLASDAYFPFRDTVDSAAAAGIAAVIQPGGSMRDEESIAAADEHGMVMLLTGMRHFKH